MTKRKPKSEHKPNGRPSEMTEEKINKLEYVFSLDWTIKEACFYADISHETYYNWLEKKPELVERFNALRERPVLLARESVITNMKKNWELALKYLERKKKTEFTPKQEIDTTIQWAIKIEQVKEMSDEDLLALTK